MLTTITPEGRIGIRVCVDHKDLKTHGHAVFFAYAERANISQFGDKLEIVTYNGENATSQFFVIGKIMIIDPGTSNRVEIDTVSENTMIDGDFFNRLANEEVL